MSADNLSVAAFDTPYGTLAMCFCAAHNEMFTMSPRRRSTIDGAASDPRCMCAHAGIEHRVPPPERLLPERQRPCETHHFRSSARSRPTHCSRECPAVLARTGCDRMRPEPVNRQCDRRRGACSRQRSPGSNVRPVTYTGRALRAELFGGTLAHTATAARDECDSTFEHVPQSTTTDKDRDRDMGQGTGLKLPNAAMRQCGRSDDSRFQHCLRGWRRKGR